MKKFLILIFVCIAQILTVAQNFHIQAFTGINRTSINEMNYTNKTGYLVTGARMAIGLDFLQLGFEIENDLNSPIFILDSLNAEDEFINNYYGGFFRVNISSVPAYRFGLIIKGGAGLMRTTFNRVYTDELTENLSKDYDNSIAYHGGIGFSSPIKDRLHLEFLYQYNWTRRKELIIGTALIPSFREVHHAFHFGISYNLVIGKAAKEAERILAQRPW